MPANHFIYECEKRGIAPSVALENDELRTALLERDDDKVIAILNEQF